MVGIDEGLFRADFRAGEKLAQLLIQVAGRAGRADTPGEVLLQTHHPGHPLLQTLIDGGYHAFAEAELAQREAAGFPPFAHLALLRAEAQAGRAANAFLLAAQAALRAGDCTRVERVTARCRHRCRAAPATSARSCCCRRRRAATAARRARRRHCPRSMRSPDARKVRWSLDVDPVDLY